MSDTKYRTAGELELALEELIGGIQEYEDYLDIPVISQIVEMLEQKIAESGAAQDSDHEDDEVLEDQDYDEE
jgi:hypothetical protein